MIKIRLKKDMVMRLYACFFQAMRSVHRAHGGSWAGFREYYQGQRMENVRMLLQQLLECLAPAKALAWPRDRIEAMQYLPELGFFRVVFGSLINRRRQTWLFALSEIQFMAANLYRLLRALDSPARPDEDTLIEFRMDLGACCWPMDARCYGLADIKRASFIEHFDRTEWYPHLQLWEILGEAPPDVSSPASPAKAAG